MKPIFAVVTAASSLCFLASQGLCAERPVLHNANSDERLIVRNIISDKVATGEHGAMAPALKVGWVDLDNDGDDDLIAMQMAFCSNHDCDYYFVIRDDPPYWTAVTSLTSWAVPYLADPGDDGDMRDVIVFDHVTDDCMACTPPKAVRWTWNGNEYEQVGIVSNQALFPISASAD
ncbi:hypothetical protein GOE09_19970 [Sinorhizobium medicae]|nr:hypothetical protein [Sinorhizobium medicae]